MKIIGKIVFYVLVIILAFLAMFLNPPSGVPAFIGKIILIVLIYFGLKTLFKPVFKKKE